MVGDEILGEPMSWDVTTFRVDFRTHQEGAPLNDASYVLDTPIEHYFPPPAAKPMFLIPASICGGIVLTMLAFFWLMFTQLGANLEQMPTGFMGRIFTLLFLGTLFWIQALFLLFWVRLNLL